MILPIQIILSLGAVVLAIVAIIKIQNRPALKVGILAVMTLSVTTIFFPDLSTLVANYLGVGRGADLIMYLGFLNTLVLYLLLYLKYRKLKEQMTDVVRDLAILQAEKLKKFEKGA